MIINIIIELEIKISVILYLYFFFSSRRRHTRCLSDRSSDVCSSDLITAERRMLCIRLEILMDIESPPEDRALRMQYQLQQMNQSGLGQPAIEDRKSVV